MADEHYSLQVKASRIYPSKDSELSHQELMLLADTLHEKSFFQDLNSALGSIELTGHYYGGPAVRYTVSPPYLKLQTCMGLS